MTKKTPAKKVAPKKAVRALRFEHPTLRNDLKASLALEDASATVDALGAINAKIAKLTKQADAYKSSLKALGKDRVEGKRYYAVISEVEQDRLNSARAKSFLTIKQIIDCTDTVKSTRVALYDL
jgi:hypothetical protein